MSTPHDLLAPHKPTILVVDDAPENLSLLADLLAPIYRVKIASRAARALQIASATPPDLILLDVNMPEMDGYEACRRLKAAEATAGVPVIFLSGRSEAVDEQAGLAAGAVDYIAKPICPPILQARVAAQLALKLQADFLRDQSAFLAQEIARRTSDIAKAQDVTILAMASMAETRDNETGNHLRRTQHYIRILAERLQAHPDFADQLDDATIELMVKSAPLHDIGKVGIPDRILLKPGRYTPEEFAIMKSHPAIGRDAILQAEAALGHEVPFLSIAKEIAYSHQEKWDGSGYPQGLAGGAIPLSARLMALADVYDALISERVYKPAMPHEDAAAFIIAGSGSHFDPAIVQAFVQQQDAFRAIAARFADNAGDLQRKAVFYEQALGEAP